MAAVLEMGWQSTIVQRRKSRPPLGLRNLGNTCYLNSVLQCLTYTPPLANLCLKNHHSALCHRLDAGEKRECPFCILEKRIARSLNLEAQHDAPSKIRNRVFLFAEHFQWGRQEDAHEFLRYVIDTCHNTCLKLLTSLRSPISNEATKEGSAIRDGNTIVKDIFGGSLVSQLKCLSCGNESKKIDEIMDISLDIFQSNTLNDALKRFFQPEVLDGDNKYSCGMCKKLSVARKQLSVLHAPNVLVIQLKRFEGIYGGKINRDIAFEEILLLSGFMSKTSQDPCPEYSLFGSIVHSGHSLESGHYYTYIKDPTGQWYCCNDAYVSLSTSQEVLSEKVYILFYIRDNKKPMYSNLNGNGHLQIQKTSVITKSPKMKPNAECSERNVPTELETGKIPLGLKTNVDILKNQKKRTVSTSANGGMPNGNKSPARQNTEKLSTPIPKEKYSNTLCTVADMLPNSNTDSSDMNVLSHVSEHVKNEGLLNGDEKTFSSKLEKHESHDSQNVAVTDNALSSHPTIENTAYKFNSNVTSHKRKLDGDFYIPLHGDGLSDVPFIKTDNQHSVIDLQDFKKLLSEQTSSQLRTCGWVDEVLSFMRTRKKLCIKEFEVPFNSADLRKALITDAKKIFIPELPQALKQNLIRHLQSFSKGKMSQDA